ncbi:MAG: class I SAM-dependent RNA methyltransferase, partial [Coriobacteriales bacterium]|nr:class I SAM-dependent RNA methyltransferase [Coriobacteriales bacterium]
RVLVKESRGRRTSGVEVLKGRGFWRERLAGHDFAISAPSFFQVNTLVAEKMVQRTIALLGPAGCGRTVDLYSGAGTFTLPLAERCADVIAVESEGSSVRDLRRNLEKAGLWAEVIGGDAARELPELGRIDGLVVDPPRAGLAPDAIAAISNARPARIVYVSCDPPTLARDVARLAEMGFRLVEATPFDLFPQSWHVETLALLEPS